MRAIHWYILAVLAGLAWVAGLSALMVWVGI